MKNFIYKINLIIVILYIFLTSCEKPVDWNVEKEKFQIENGEDGGIILMFNDVPFNGRLKNINNISQFFVFERNGIESEIRNKRKTAQFKNGKLHGEYYQLLDNNDVIVYDLKLSEGEIVKKIKYGLTKEEKDLLLNFLNGSWYFDRPPNVSWGVQSNSYSLGIEFEIKDEELKYYVNDYSVTDIDPDSYSVSRTVDKSLGNVYIKTIDDKIEIQLKGNNNTTNVYVFTLKFPDNMKDLDMNDKLVYIKKTNEKEKEILSKEGDKWNSKGDIKSIFFERTKNQWWSSDWKLYNEYSDEYLYDFEPVGLRYFHRESGTLEGNKTFKPGKTKYRF